MTSPPPDLDKQPLELLIKIMRMTEAEDNIALTAIRRANSHLKKMGTDWEALLRGKVKIIADPFASINIPASAMNPNRNQDYTPAPPRRPAPQAPPRPQPRPAAPSPRPQPRPASPLRQALADPGPGNGTLERIIVNKFDGTCIKCQNKVLAGHGTSSLWKRSDGKTKWISEHTGTCPPKRKFKPATTSDDFQV
jgi:hypothetical protein